MDFSDLLSVFRGSEDDLLKFVLDSTWEMSFAVDPHGLGPHGSCQPPTDWGRIGFHTHSPEKQGFAGLVVCAAASTFTPAISLRLQRQAALQAEFLGCSSSKV